MSFSPTLSLSPATFNLPQFLPQLTNPLFHYFRYIVLSNRAISTLLSQIVTQVLELTTKVKLMYRRAAVNVGNGILLHRVTPTSTIHTAVTSLAIWMSRGVTLLISYVNVAVSHTVTTSIKGVTAVQQPEAATTVTMTTAVNW